MLADLQRLIQEASELAGAAPGTCATCHNCGGLFIGPSNQHYCKTECRRKFERTREKIKRITDRQPQLDKKERQAINNNDFHNVRMIRARRARDLIEFADMIEKLPQSSRSLIPENSIMVTMSSIEKLKHKYTTRKF